MKEFVSDTEPTNSASYLRVESISGALSLSFKSSAKRKYGIRLNDELINGAWYSYGNVIRGSGGVLVWTNLPPATNTARFHAVEPMLPQ